MRETLVILQKDPRQNDGARGSSRKERGDVEDLSEEGLDAGFAEQVALLHSADFTAGGGGDEVPAPLEIDQIFRADGLDVIREVERAIIDDNQSIVILNELDELGIAHGMPQLPKVLRRGDDRADDPTRTDLRGSVAPESVSFEQLFEIFAQSAQGQLSVTREIDLFRIDVYDERWGERLWLPVFGMQHLQYQLH